MDEKENIQLSNRYYLKGFGFQVLLIFITAVVITIYMLLHGLNIYELLQQPTKTWTFDFLGGNANPASIGAEIMAWSFIGVSCQMAYLSGKAILQNQFQFWQYFIRWVSASLLSWGVAVAVIFALTVITVDIGGIEITLAKASIETIIAISFILGFYNDESRGILEKLRERIVTGLKSKE